MTEDQYRQLRRRLLRDGVADDTLLDQLRLVARSLVRRRALPPAYAPYGDWNAEAEAEVFQSWASDRLIGEGQLRSLIASAGDLSSLRSLAELSLRQHLINQATRSHSQNLYARVRKLLEAEPAFRCFVDSARPSQRWWGLANWHAPQPFDGDDRRLLSAAWSVGPLELVRYRATAKKLSPIFGVAELYRYVTGTLAALGELLTAGLLLRGLQLRIDLDPPMAEQLDQDHAEQHGPAVMDLVALRETAVAAIGELSRRQVEVLLGTDAGDTLDEMAQRLGCSRVTILNEQRRAGGVLTRLSGDDRERDGLLNTVLEVLYEGTS